LKERKGNPLLKVMLLISGKGRKRKVRGRHPQTPRSSGANHHKQGVLNNYLKGRKRILMCGPKKKKRKEKKS